MDRPDRETALRRHPLFHPRGRLFGRELLPGFKTDQTSMVDPGTVLFVYDGQIVGAITNIGHHPGAAPPAASDTSTDRPELLRPVAPVGVPGP